MTSIIHVWQRRSWLHLTSRCRHPDPGQDLIPLQRLHVFAHSRDPHPAIKLWCQVPFTKSKTMFQFEMYWMQCFLKSKCIKSRTFNDKNQWIIKKVMVFKKLLQHLATRGTYSPGDWRCDEAWREQTLVYPPVMCQQRLIYCTWELNVMHWHCGNLTIAPVPAKQPWWIWIHTSCEFIMNDCITTTKQSTTKPCAYFLGYTVHPVTKLWRINHTKFSINHYGIDIQKDKAFTFVINIIIIKYSVFDSFSVSTIIVLNLC